MEISHDEYQVQYDEARVTITCQGSLRLRGGDGYKPILDLLFRVAETKPEKLTLDVRELTFLNSSGINIRLQFILQVRKNKASEVVILTIGKHSRKISDGRSLTLQWPPFDLQKGFLIV